MWSRIMQRFLLVFMSCISVLMLIRDAHSFNVDTKFPMLYSDTENGSYFGYTVVLHTPEGEVNSRLYIGAPRGRVKYATRSRVAEKSAGKVFECVVDDLDQSCQQQTDGRRTLDLNDGDWMGAAMDVQQVGSCSRFMVCGHHWYDSTPRSQYSAYFMSGACYRRSEIFPNTRYNEELMQPILRHGRTQSDILGFPAYDWHIGQAGISLHFTLPDPRYVQSSSGWQTSDPKEDLLIGAPGILNWGGGVVICKGDPCGSNKECAVPSMANIANNYDLTGYQVNSGRFFKSDQLVYVASAPRSQKNVGRVILLQVVNTRREKEWSVITSEVGSNVGEYFGASLAVGDFNNDGLDDLVVGSPLRFTEHDEGCINIYYGNRNGAVLRRLTVRSICGESPGARFGTTLTTLGDLNRDGYVDLAVGAPYEADNRGAVYIYNGGPGGLEAAYSQRIAAEDVDEHLRGFGISIARPVDVDGNKYVDLAIGSYISGNVVVLRSHPVVQLLLDIQTNVNKISQDTSNFILTACVEYEGYARPQQLPVRRTIRLVDEYSRARFTDSDSLVHAEEVELSVLDRNCNQFQVSIIQNLQSNYLGALEIRLSASLAYNENDEFCKTCAVLDRDQLHPVTTQRLEFTVNCGDKDYCESELKLNFKFIGNGSSTDEYVIGSESKSLLLIEVVNDGETAYGVQVNITIPSPVEVARVPPNCRSVDVKSNSSDSTLTCDVVRPLKQGQNETLVLSLDMRPVTSDGTTDKLDFALSVSTSSKDNYLEGNSKTLTLHLRSDADISISGKAVEKTYYYGRMNSSIISFTHEYYIEKFGISPIEKVGIVIRLPTEMSLPNSNEEIHFLDIYQPSGFEQGYEPLNCDSEFETYLRDTDSSDHTELDSSVVIDNSTDVIDNSTVVNYNTESDNSTAADEPMRRKRSESRNEESGKIKEAVTHFPTNRTFFVNCSMTNVRCKKVTCKTRPLLVEKSNVRLSIRMQLNMSGLERYLDKKDIIQLGTQGSVQIEQPANIEALGAVKRHPYTATVATTFLGSVIQEEVAEWLIALSVGGGLLFLCLVVMGLVKAGFFERKKKEELKALISADTEERAFAEARLSVLEALSEEG